MADSKKQIFKTVNSQFFFAKISGIGPWDTILMFSLVSSKFLALRNITLYSLENSKFLSFKQKVQIFGPGLILVHTNIFHENLEPN